METAEARGAATTSVDAVKIGQEKPSVHEGKLTWQDSASDLPSSYYLIYLFVCLFGIEVKILLP